MADAETDMLLVNPGGRVVEVTNEDGQELLARGFKVASEEQAKAYKAGQQAIMPEVLAKQEEARVKGAQKAAEAFFKSDKTELSVDPAKTAAEQDEAAQHPLNGQVVEDKPKSRKSK